MPVCFIWFECQFILWMSVCFNHLFNLNVSQSDIWSLVFFCFCFVAPFFFYYLEKEWNVSWCNRCCKLFDIWYCSCSVWCPNEGICRYLMCNTCVQFCNISQCSVFAWGGVGEVKHVSLLCSPTVCLSVLMCIYTINNSLLKISDHIYFTFGLQIMCVFK